ncbi:MAG: PepSY-like domain-containing protein [Bacteroidales bacterium]|nr:PepSY-like domain-containing protein [Bacteroidales bacterium]
MKRLSTLLLTLLFVGTCAIAANGPINKKHLPKQAQTFIRDYWPNVEIIDAERDNGLYKVEMEDGTVLRFDNRGEWRSITNQYGFPTHYLPDGISEFIHSQYPSSYIARVIHNANGYIVILNSGLELQYDNGGHIQRVAD